LSFIGFPKGKIYREGVGNEIIFSQTLLKKLSLQTYSKHVTVLAVIQKSVKNTN
jgi:hypothetical protein